MEKAILGAGCFWGVESTFRKLDGVTETEVGYSGGHTVDASYEEVCSGKTGHAEVVQVTFDPEKLSYHKILNVFWDCHDPTTLNRQGPDFGTQYRSAIFYLTIEQEKVAQASKDKLVASGRFRRPIVTEVTAAGPFHRAEDYHQQYIEKREQTFGQRHGQRSAISRLFFR